jgi:hypothetical protein
MCGFLPTQGETGGAELAGSARIAIARVSDFRHGRRPAAPTWTNRWELVVFTVKKLLGLV